MSKARRSPLHVFAGGLLALLLSAHGQSLAAQATTPEDSVRALENARGQALLHADTVALGRMIGDEFIEI